MEYKDYYKILDVEPGADQATIKKNYRFLARKFHPDVSKEANAEEKFKELQEAYKVLKNDEKRTEYDQIRAGNQAGAEFRPPPGWDQQQQHARGFSDDPFEDLGGYSDFFQDIFGQRQQQAKRPQRGQDQNSQFNITLEEAFRGSQRQLQLQQPKVDPATGQVTYKTRTINVKIPVGVVQDQSIRLKGLGSPGFNGGKAGDIYLQLNILPNKQYQLEGRDIYLDLPITPWEAALGGKIKVPTLGGVVELNIPAGSQSGKKLRLKGRGIPGKSPGDQYVILNIHAPSATTDAHRDLYKKMADEMAFNPRQNLA